MQAEAEAEAGAETEGGESPGPGPSTHTHLEAGGVDDADVGGHAVAKFALDDVTAHEVRRVARHRLPVADHGGHLRAVTRTLQ